MFVVDDLAPEGKPDPDVPRDAGAKPAEEFNTSFFGVQYACTSSFREDMCVD